MNSNYLDLDSNLVWLSQLKFLPSLWNFDYSLVMKMFCMWHNYASHLLFTSGKSLGPRLFESSGVGKFIPLDWNMSDVESDPALWNIWHCLIEAITNQILYKMQEWRDFFCPEKFKIPPRLEHATFVILPTITAFTLMPPRLHRGAPIMDHAVGNFFAQ